MLRKQKVWVKKFKAGVLISDGDPLISRKRILIHIPGSQRIIKTDSCPYLVKCSLDVLKKKTEVLDIFDTDKKGLIKNNIESSPQEIWIPITGFNSKLGCKILSCEIEYYCCFLSLLFNMSVRV